CRHFMCQPWVMDQARKAFTSGYKSVLTSVRPPFRYVLLFLWRAYHFELGVKRWDLYLEARGVVLPSDRTYPILHLSLQILVAHRCNHLSGRPARAFAPARRLPSNSPLRNVCSILI